MEERKPEVGVVAVTTRAKAERPEDQPPWLDKFTVTFTGAGEDGEAVDAFIKGLPDQGYTHYMNITVNPRDRVSVGPIDGEWRILAAAVFFKRKPTPDDFAQLAAGQAGEAVPIFEQRKAYAHMQGIGRGQACAILEPDEVAAWIEFFGLKPGSVKPISELTS